MLRGTTRREVVTDAVFLDSGTTVLFTALGLGVGPSLFFAAANLVAGFAVRGTTALMRRQPLTAPLRPGIVNSRDLLELSATAVVASVLWPRGCDGALDLYGALVLDRADQLDRPELLRNLRDRGGGPHARGRSARTRAPGQW